MEPTFNIAVTGDWGVDIYTHYIPGYISEGNESPHPEIAFDVVDVPSGAGLHHIAIESLLDLQPINWKPKESTLAKSIQFLRGEYRWGDKNKNVIRISRTTPLKRHAENRANSLELHGTGNENVQALLIHDASPIHDASSLWHTSREPGDRISQFFTNIGKGETGETPKVFVILEDDIPNLRVHQSETKALVGEKESPVWTALLENKEKVAILCSVSSLRHAGAKISRRLSWEQGVEDIVADLELFQPLKTLSKFRHLFIRVGFVGAVHIQTPKLGKRSGQVVFAPRARNAIFCDETKEGRIRGQDSVVAACLLQSIRSRGASTAEWTPDEIAEALKKALTANMYLFEEGFHSPSIWVKFAGESTAGVGIAGEFLASYFGKNTEIREKKDNDRQCKMQNFVTKPYNELIKDSKFPTDRIFGTVCSLPFPSSACKVEPWDILRSQIKKYSISQINLGIAICKFGHQQVLNRPIDVQQGAGKSGASVPALADPDGPWKVKLEDLIKLLEVPECRLSADETPDDETLADNVPVAVPQPADYCQPTPDYCPPTPDYCPPTPKAKSLFVPLFEVGKFIAIERTEIESFRSIQNLMQLYVESQGKATTFSRPLSIAVFGAPGSGKSFAIKEFVKSINATVSEGSDQLEIIECNVAQFRTVDDLGHAITRIASVNNQRKIPLVFFDEFDCHFAGHNLGWLKFFLAPMQDGTFYGASQTISFGRAIFVFAGGINRTIAEFDPFSQPISASETEKKLKLQAEFKDQKGPDFISRLRGHINISSLNPDEKSPKSPSGRTVKPILRRALTLRGLILGGNHFVKRDGCEVANVDNDLLYAFLTVESYRHGVRSMEAILQMCTPIDGVIEKASLPSHTQLNMHVDADDFMVRVLRGRFRKFIATNTVSQ